MLDNNKPNVNKVFDDKNKSNWDKIISSLRIAINKSIASLKDIPELEDPTFEQDEWMRKKRFN